ncbi:MAG: hypothetical protein D6778_10015, partial [Nitrospirae bacterium]
VLDAIKAEFLKAEEGCNVLVAHGTGETSDGANITYLGLDRMVSQRWSNVFVGSVEGILTREEALQKAKACPVKRIRFVPFMFVAGDHIMNDIMGQEPDEEGNLSWALEMKRAGFQVEAPTVTYKGKTYYKGLGFYPEVDRVFIRNIIRGLKELAR